MPDSEVFILNNVIEQRTSKTGKQRYTVVVKTEPLVINTDPKSLGAPVANAIAHHLRERVKGISAVAPAATLAARKVAAKAFAAGESWAMKRYSGGRTGPKPPNQTNRAFNDSGRFADSIVANASKDDVWRVNVAANRLSGDAATVTRIWNRLIELVPEFGDASKLMSNDIIKASIRKAQAGMIQKAQQRTNELRVDAAKALFKVGSQLLSLLAG